MAAHANPYQNSRLIDICRWSGCPEVGKLVLAVEDKLKRMSSFRPNTRRQEHIRTFVLDLYHRLLEDPSGYIAYSRDRSFYTIPARYNPRKIGYGPTIAVFARVIHSGPIASRWSCSGDTLIWLLDMCSRPHVTRIKSFKYR